MRQLVQRGNRVIAACRQPAQATELQALPGVSVTQLDVASPESVARWAASLRSITPPVAHIDLCINNAGVYGQRINLDTGRPPLLLLPPHGLCG